MWLAWATLRSGNAQDGIDNKRPRGRAVHSRAADSSPARHPREVRLGVNCRGAAGRRARKKRARLKALTRDGMSPTGPSSALRQVDNPPARLAGYVQVLEQL